ncbi:A disintegrin and metalloproteinase with thrombospondin motifs 7 [Armadillidium nasatum]|uniref:A disintegrin and metalloproteinase with thrombospondin motifs 7 n=1 Tax=Armadillidium nasatum TaxID=96803 RepID=A0A5N5T0F4_9CRUS|nr:A disintegrin and metalloproteinase with thrombospondin motifs 7 [Armadillidium nasatum]
MWKTQVVLSWRMCNHGRKACSNSWQLGRVVALEPMFEVMWCRCRGRPQGTVTTLLPLTEGNIAPGIGEDIVSVILRAIQCSKFDNEPYKGKNYTWRPVTIEEHPCQLHCKPDNEFYSVELKDSVIDGTPCKPGRRDMCIHGVCKRVACDWIIEGSAQEDRCGLCHGDGTQCVTTQGIFNLTYGVSYERIVTFPVGARNVRIEELGSAANYLAIKDLKSDKFYLNGNWIIQWSGEYNADGVMMYYKRENDTETLFLPGPVVKPLTLMLLFQTKNVGVKWEYTLPHENATYTPEFHWKHSDWSVCTSTCGTGTQVSKAQCMEKESGLVENKYCDKKKKPRDKIRECNTHPCPAWWWSGPWQPCSVTCGEKGKRRRTVICVRSYGPTEQMALMDSDCSMSLKPHEEESCPNLHPCITDRSWLASPWINSCKGDPCEYQKRIVTCVAPKLICNPLTKPPERRQCGNITCGRWRVGKWEKCSTTCGDGVQIRNVECVGGTACAQSEEPASVKECNLRNCALKHQETLIELPSGDLSPPDPEIIIQNVTFFPENDDKKSDFNSTNSTTINKFIISDVKGNNITEDYNDLTINDTPQLISKDSLGNQAPQNTTKTDSTENDNKKEDEEITIMLEKEEIPNIENISLSSTFESNKTKFSIINEKEEEGIINKEPIGSDQYKENATDAEIKNSTNSSSNDSNYESFPNYESAPDDYYDFDPQEGASSRHSEKNKEKDEKGNISNGDKIIETETKTKNEIDVENKENEIEDFENYNKTFIKHSNIETESKILPEINKTENITHNYNYDENDDYNYEDDYYYDEYDNNNNISENDTLEERPTGFVEDKIDIEGVQVIEIKLKKNKKNKKGKNGKKETIKKVKVHTGAEAIKVLNKFTRKANSKQMTSKMTPKSKKKNQDESVTPIYKWEVGSWSQCSESCGGGIQHRSVECYSSGALVPPWDCLEFPPPDSQHCNMFQCLNWTVSEFGPCPVTCGKGIRTRNATCPKEGKCHPRDLPALQEECENAPCVHWVEGPWSMCTKSCGTGYQIRFVKCVDLRSQEASQDCVEERPAHKRSCNSNKCPEKILVTIDIVRQKDKLINNCFSGHVRSYQVIHITCFLSVTLMYDLKALFDTKKSRNDYCFFFNKYREFISFSYCK